MSIIRLTNAQQIALVALRTLVGWHFLYEGYTKLLYPAWGQDGAPVASWTSGAYLKAASGPLAPLFHWVGQASWIGSVDVVIAVALTAIGTSLMLGLLTQTGCTGGLVLLAIFYLSSIPTGSVDARAEGTYLIVNKNLVEAGAVAVLLTFRTGSIAGLDRLWMRRRQTAPRGQEAVA